MRSLVSFVIVGAVAGTAVAQPADGPAPDPSGPLAELRDEKQLTEVLASITNDPAIPVDDPETRALAQALMIEGVRQLQAKSYDQALANFLEAYGKFPSPRILLNIGSTLRDMGRLADAANTYQRYLTDPATGPERIAEVKEVLLRLDEQLTILTIRVYPTGSELSIDAGPFIPVGTALVTRVRPGIHLVRVRAKGGSNEVTVNGFEGENKEVAATIKMDTEVPVVVEGAAPPPDKVDGWLITGTQYGSENASSNARTVRSGFSGPEVRPLMPTFRSRDDDPIVVRIDTGEGISSGVVAALRIDGEGRGA
ncbi:MAG: tetratricopeptide repeat protein, partial [Myxococcales bacterium]|nr:tetratricopeptide repeat protein [Myxococcales bacterium]